MKVKFSERMNTKVVYEKLNSTYVDIFITPYLDDGYTDNRNVNLTWNTTKFVNETLFIQLNFSDPLMISNQLRYDNITFHVINSSDIFISQNGLLLNHISKNMSSKIPKQMYQTNFTRDFV